MGRRRCNCLGVGAAIAAAVVTARAAETAAQAPATVNVSVDATVAGTPLERVWPYFGYDEVNYTTTAPGQALLRTLATAHTVPVHVRTHFLLNTGNGAASLKWGSTNAYTEDAAGNPVYSWTLMDGIMDAITAAGAFPMVEIAFMPQALSTRPTPYQNTGIYELDGGCFYPPKDYPKWGALIREWATHVNARYPNVGSSWMWELWNEPDIGYWHGTAAEFSTLYDYTEAAVHQVLPNAPVGGPAVASAGTFLTQFLQHCATGANAATGQTGARLDLISFHAKGGVAITGGHVQMNLGNQMRLHRNGFNIVQGFAQYRQTPIHITEADPDGCAACPVSMTPADAYRNSPAYGAYEMAMMKRSLELATRTGVKLGGVLTWAFTFPNTPYFAGYRALTTNGITLPVLGAFKLLGKLDGTRLPVTSSGALTLDAILNNSVRQQADVDAMSTLNGQQVQVLVWNYHDDLVATAASPVHLSVKVPASFGSRVMVTHLRVDETHGDAYTVWTGQGSPASPSAAQIAALQAGMEPVALNPGQTVDVVGGAAALDFDLPRFGISLLTLSAAAPSGDAAVDMPTGDAGVQDVAMEGGPDTGAADTVGGEAGAADRSNDLPMDLPTDLPMDLPATVDVAIGDGPGDAGGGITDGASDGASPSDVGVDMMATVDGAPPVVDAAAPLVDAAPDAGGATLDAPATADRVITPPGGSGSAGGCACALTDLDAPSRAPIHDLALVGLAGALATLLGARRRARSKRH